MGGWVVRVCVGGGGFEPGRDPSSAPPMWTSAPPMWKQKAFCFHIGGGKRQYYCKSFRPSREVMRGAFLTRNLLFCIGKLSLA